MVLITSLAAALLAPAALALNHGDACGYRGRGTCVGVGECAGYAGGRTTVGDCPGLPNDVRCCTVPGCMWTTDNKCPQYGPSIKWVNEWKACAFVETGKCPGPYLFRKTGPMDWKK